MLFKIKIALYAIILLIVFLLAFEFDSANQALINHTTLAKANLKAFDIFIEPCKIEDEKYFNKLWGIKPPPKKRPKKKKITHIVKKRKKPKPKKIDIKLKGNTICYKKKYCYKLLALFEKDGTLYATFYANFKPRHNILSFRAKDELPKTPIYINKIDRTKVILKEKNSTKMWHLGLFDVNATKYLPKEKKYESFE